MSTLPEVASLRVSVNSRLHTTCFAPSASMRSSPDCCPLPLGAAKLGNPEADMTSTRSRAAGWASGAVWRLLLWRRGGWDKGWTTGTEPSAGISVVSLQQQQSHHAFPQDLVKGAVHASSARRLETQAGPLGPCPMKPCTLSSQPQILQALGKGVSNLSCIVMLLAAHIVQELQ